MDNKEKLWIADKITCKDRMTELSEYFGGKRGLGKVEEDVNYKEWFNQMSIKIDSLDLLDT